MDVKGVKERYKKQLFALPNVVSLGVGPKIRNGRATGDMAIKVYVSQKVELSKLDEKDRIPSRLDGVPTDVELLEPSRKR